MDVERRDVDGWPVLVWRAGSGWRMVASTVAGGGIGPRTWVINAQVPRTYARTDPAAHIGEIATACRLTGTGVGMLTAAKVERHTRAGDGGVDVVATVGLAVVTWAAAPEDEAPGDEGPGDEAPEPVPAAHTVNLLVAVPVALTDAALVNAVLTATEAKTQALFEAGFAGTGTASDAICVAARESGERVTFAGPRSEWGARLARAVHGAVLEGAVAWSRRNPSEPASAAGPAGEPEPADRWVARSRP
jgi:adenosylcobinamide amidohydrolase